MKTLTVSSFTTSVSFMNCTVTLSAPETVNDTSIKSTGASRYDVSNSPADGLSSRDSPLPDRASSSF